MRKPSWKFHSKILTGFKFAHFPKLLFFKKKVLKTNKIWKIHNFFLYFWWQFYRAFQWYVVCFNDLFWKRFFGKMGMEYIKWRLYPSTIHSFSINLNEEALLKVSFKNIYWFQICPFSKTTGFSKKGPKSQQILKN